ncbi:MAG TPA: hypothetical protein PK649_07685 [Vicingus sp.]|nr:hypothetical protein [Flavobacteriales bacterium]HRN41937.1 hypothetical protein [Vicingus sp.]
MNKLIITLFLIVPLVGLSQSSEELKFDELFTQLDTMPTYVDGEEALLQFFNENSSMKFIKKKKYGSLVSINFIVSKEGKVYEPKVLVSTTKEKGEEVKRLILLTHWEPGIRKGKKVNVSHNLVVNVE